MLWFLPVVGIEMLPIGLLLLALDVPFLRKPVGRALLWLENEWTAFRRRRRRRKTRGKRDPRPERRARPQAQGGAEKTQPADTDS